MEAINYIGLLVMTWLIVEGAAPVQYVKKLFQVHGDDAPKPLVKQVIRELLKCCLCTGFWVGLIYYFFHYENYILAACLTSVGAELFARVWKFLTHKVFNQL